MLTNTSFCSGPSAVLPCAWMPRFQDRHTDASWAHSLVQDWNNFSYLCQFVSRRGLPIQPTYTLRSTERPA